MIITGQAEKIIKFRKSQKKNVRKPRRPARLDGQMTPLEYSNSALTKAQRNESVSAKEIANEAFPKGGSKEMQQLIKGYEENLEKLRLMLRGQ
ncbi:hypothetical protein M1567_01410 [Candidatus Marsarchaeota archaeon]|nr:hypothetical protein [Candidatus Marsarchaeota archaeon]